MLVTKFILSRFALEALVAKSSFRFSCFSKEDIMVGCHHAAFRRRPAKRVVGQARDTSPDIGTCHHVAGAPATAMEDDAMMLPRTASRLLQVLVSRVRLYEFAGLLPSHFRSICWATSNDVGDGGLMDRVTGFCLLSTPRTTFSVDGRSMILSLIIFSKP